MNATCHNCSDYEPNVKKLNDIIVLASVRSGNPKMYDGEPFEFCPWCGGILSNSTELSEEQPSEISNQTTI